MQKSDFFAQKSPKIGRFLPEFAHDWPNFGPKWSKFAPIVAKSVFNEKLSDFEAIKKLESNGAKLDSKIKDLLNKKIVHNEVLELNKVKERIISWL